MRASFFSLNIQMNTPIKTLGAALIAGIMATGCASQEERLDQRAFVERPVEVLYTEAAEELDNRSYADAILQFSEVERQHPFSEWARRSMLMSAYASYQANRYDAAIQGAQRYIALYPGTESAAYAYYLIAVSHFERIVDVGRDQRTTENALAALQDVVRRFPESAYARDAQLKIDMARDQLAGKEMEVGRFYLRENDLIAAAGRFQKVIDDYQTTSHVAEALHRLTEVYLSLGLRDQAMASSAILGANYPGSPWYEQSYALMTEAQLTPITAPDRRERGFFRGLRESLF